MPCFAFFAFGGLSHYEPHSELINSKKDPEE